MTRKALLLLVLAAALLLLFGYWRSDRNVIQRRLDGLEELLAKSGPEDQLTAFGRARKVSEMFAPGFLVLARPYEGAIRDRQELARVVAGYRGSVRTLRLVNRQRSVAVDRERGTARMRLRVEAWTDSGGGPSRQSYDFRIAWLKEAGDWLIQEVDLLEVDTGAWPELLDDEPAPADPLE